MVRRIGVLIICAASLAGGCSGSTPGANTVAPSTELPATTTEAPPPAVTTTPESSQPSPTVTAPANEVEVGLGFAPQTLNPFAPNAGPETFEVAGAIMAGAHRLDPSLQLRAELVETLPSLDNGLVEILPEGGMAVEWPIHPDATWSDGRPVTGHDFLFTLEVLQEFFGAPNQWWQGRRLPSVVDATANDAAVRVVFADVDFGYEELFRYVLPKHAVEVSDVAADWDDASWPTAAPFLVEEWDRASGVVRLARNSHYWRTDPATGAALPYLDAVVLRATVDGTPPDYRAGFDVDVAWLGPPVVDVAALREDGIVVEVVPGRVWEHIAWQFDGTNPGRDPLINTLAFRRAVATALNVDQLVAATGGLLAPPPESARPASHLPRGSDGGWTRYASDEAAAAALLADACASLERDCLTDVPVLRLTTTSNSELRPRIAAEVERQLESVLSIDVEIVWQDSQVFFGETLDAAEWDTAVWAWLARIGEDGVVRFLQLFDPDQRNPDDNPYRWGRPGSVADPDAASRYRELLAEVERTIDPDRIDELAAEAIQILADDVVIIPLASRPVVLARRDSIDGPVPHPDPEHVMWNIETWRRTDTGAAPQD